MQNPNDQIAPNSVEAEEALLGSILINPHIVSDLLWLHPSDFWTVKNGWIFDVMVSLHNRRENIDDLTITAELRIRNQLDAIGGSAYLVYITNYTPTYTNYYTYAKIIQESSRQRQILKYASEIANAAIAGNPDYAKDMIERAQSLLSAPGNQMEEMRRYLIHARDLRNLPAVSWLVPGEIPELGLTLVYGPSGVGKSFFVLDYAMKLAQQHPVLYIASEGEYGYAARVGAWCKHYDKPEGELYFYMNVVSLLDREEASQFTKTIQFIKPKLIVIDTLAHSMLPGDENNTRDMGLFVKTAKSMSRELSCAVLLVHHTGKEGKNERGNSALRAACDVMIKLSGDDDIIIVECSKSKDAQAFPTRYIRLLPVQVNETVNSPVVIEAEKVKQTQADPLTRNQRKVLEALALESFASGASTNDLVDVTDLPRGSVLRVISALKLLNFVQMQAGASPYSITPLGRQMVTPDSVVTRSSDSVDSPLGEPVTRLTRKIVQFPGFNDPRESNESPSQASHRVSEQPTVPCPACGAQEWAFSRVTGRWYCDPCAEAQARELTQNMDEKDRRIAAGAEE